MSGLLLFVLLGLFGWVSYDQSSKLLRRDVLNGLQTAAVSAASLIDGDKHQSIKPGVSLEDPTYVELNGRLDAYLKSRPDIVYVYSMIPSRAGISFVLDPTPLGDADGDGIEDKSLPFEVYDHDSERLREAMRQQIPVASLNAESDKWGTFVTGYAPIFDSKGSFVGLVGVDMNYASYQARFAELQRGLTTWLGISALASLAFGTLVLALTRRLRTTFDSLVETNHALDAKIADFEALTKRLALEARTDKLTGLANRAAIESKLNELAQLPEEEREGRIAIAFLDLDNFKLVNDAHGHEYGDVLLRFVCGHVEDLSSGHMVGRFGGDELVIVCLSDDAENVLSLVAYNILLRLARPIVLQEHRIHPTASIGISVWREGTRSASDLMRQADSAMYAAKAAGKNQLAVFTPLMEEKLRRRLKLEDELRRAIEERELWVAWQPIVDLSTRKMVAAEALLRWRHPSGMPVSPAEFIPVAEETGLIEAMGTQVLEEACALLGEWKSTPGREHLRLTVNVSAKQLANPEFVPLVLAVMARFGVPERRLTLEVTESILMEDVGTISSRLEELREFGCLIALDDFGTGYSSLSMLVKLPLDILKIDRAFVMDMESDARSYSLTKSLLRMGDSLGLTMVAEGVETNWHVEELHRLSSHLGQGFFFSAGLDSRQLMAYLDGDIESQKVA
ncbi:MAG: EAL domain-containing protein [Armatimonadetes bacterium]|nr:EAL domain-containing protein [Armatimonadota bacterium]